MILKQKNLTNPQEKNEYSHELKSIMEPEEYYKLKNFSAGKYNKFLTFLIHNKYSIFNEVVENTLLNNSTGTPRVSYRDYVPLERDLIILKRKYEDNLKNKYTEFIHTEFVLSNYDNYKDDHIKQILFFGTTIEMNQTPLWYLSCEIRSRFFITFHEEELKNILICNTSIFNDFLNKTSKIIGVHLEENG